ncbi:hypothetical protein BH11BAC3_BH11BAC3_10870 [soil metagenome]
MLFNAFVNDLACLTKSFRKPAVFIVLNTIMYGVSYFLLGKDDFLQLTDTC